MRVRVRESGVDVVVILILEGERVPGFCQMKTQHVMNFHTEHILDLLCYLASLATRKGRKKICLQTKRNVTL